MQMHRKIPIAYPDNRCERILARMKCDAGLEGGIDLSAGRQAASLEMLRSAVVKDVVENPNTPLGQPEADTFIETATEFLKRLGAEGPNTPTTPQDEFLAEAIVVTDGTRPAPLIHDGFVDVDDPKLGDWRADIIGAEASIRHSIAATGRVLRNGKVDPDSVYGTAWMIAPGLVATAQHVLELMAEFDPGPGIWLLRQGFTVDFSIEDGRPRDPKQRYRMASIERASPDMINGMLDLKNLDIAVVRIAENNLAAMPDPITLSTSVQSLDTEPKLYVIGHPRRFSGSWIAETEAAATANSNLIFRGILEQLLGDSFGVKRFSPGLAEMTPGTLPNDIHARVLSHDASTLEGNSGGPVLDLTTMPDRAIGLHFGGGVRKRNFALSVPDIQQHLTLPGVQFV
jgi:Trypsin-like peptidase domain